MFFANNDNFEFALVWCNFGNFTFCVLFSGLKFPSVLFPCLDFKSLLLRCIRVLVKREVMPCSGKYTIVGTTQNPAFIICLDFFLSSISDPGWPETPDTALSICLYFFAPNIRQTHRHFYLASSIVSWFAGAKVQSAIKKYSEPILVFADLHLFFFAAYITPVVSGSITWRGLCREFFSQAEGT